MQKAISQFALVRNEGIDPFGTQVLRGYSAYRIQRKEAHTSPLAASTSPIRSQLSRCIEMSL